MFDLDTLNTIIAMVVVLLVLSLLVQAIQNFVKKVFRLKSRELEKSLAQLFENIIDKTGTPAATATGVAPNAAPDAVTSAATGPTDNAPATPPITSQQLVAKILAEFKQVGRRTRTGRTVLDSLSKEDLLKILARVDCRYLYANYANKFQQMYHEIEGLEELIERLASADPPLLRGAAGARFAEMRAVVAPIINDIRSIVSGGAVKPNILLGDLVNLRYVNLDQALKLLADAQQSIASDIKAEREAGNQAAVTVLGKLSDSLTLIAGSIGRLSQRVDTAFATLRVKLEHVEKWYDTVMQGFDERYTRHMKNVSLYISIALVIYLNAGFFRVYRSISDNDIQKAFILAEGSRLLGQPDTSQAPAQTTRPGATGINTANTNTTTTPGGVNRNPGTTIPPTRAGAGNANTSPANTNPPAASAQPTPAPSPVTVAELQKELDEVRQLAGTYEGFGFAPLTMQDVRNWAGSFFAWPFSGRWLDARKQDLRSLFSWGLMVLLLSVGAPFWQDTLESLFGVKNLLRKKTATRNIEQQSGEGQPRP